MEEKSILVDRVRKLSYKAKRRASQFIENDIFVSQLDTFEYLANQLKKGTQFEDKPFAVSTKMDVKELQKMERYLNSFLKNAPTYREYTKQAKEFFNKMGMDIRDSDDIVEMYSNYKESIEIQSNQFASEMGSDVIRQIYELTKDTKTQSYDVAIAIRESSEARIKTKKGMRKLSRKQKLNYIAKALNVNAIKTL